MNRHGGYLVARFLRDRKVPLLFTLCGGHVAPIYDGCLDCGIRVVDFRHEQAAAHAADAWARVTGQPGVVVATAGPGVTGTVTAVANAFRAGSPVVVLGGQGGVADFEKGALQELDHVELMSSITKWSRRVVQVERIPEYLSMAFQRATAGRPGPVFLELPVDVLFDTATENEVVYPRGVAKQEPPEPPSEIMDELADLLSRSARAVIMAGSSVRWSEAWNELAALAQRLELPVYLNGMGRGCLPASHPSFLALTRKQALRECDVAVVLGVPFDFRMRYGEIIGPQAKIVQVEPVAEELGHNRDVDFGITADAKAFLAGLLERIPQPAIDQVPPARSWLRNLQEQEKQVRQRFAPMLLSNQKPIHPLRFAYSVSQAVDEDTIVVGDGGEIVALVASVLPVSKPFHWLDPGPLGCLGVGMPFAIAAKLAHPEKRVLVVYGDGAFGLNGMEYDTAVRFGLGIVGVVGNDRGWGQIRRPQIRMFGEERAVATALSRSARYDQLVQALGGQGVYVEDPDLIVPALRQGFESNAPYLVDVAISDQPVDPNRVVDLSKV